MIYDAQFFIFPILHDTPPNVCKKVCGLVSIKLVAFLLIREWEWYILAK